MKMSLGKSWGTKLQNRIQSFEFEVGILDDKPHNFPVVAEGVFSQQQTKNYAGGPVRKTSRQASEFSIGDVLVQNMQRLNIDILRRPFQEESSEIMRFTREFLKLAVKKPSISIRRVENLLQAIVRNPILRQEYGKNSTRTADAKGFDRHLFDTGQLFKSIKARAKRV